jgi:hypothetical protein
MKLFRIDNQYDESYKIQTLEKKCIRLQSIIDRMEVSNTNILLFTFRSTSFQ